MFNRIPTQLKKYSETQESHPRHHVEVKPSIGHKYDGINRVLLPQNNLNDIKNNDTPDIFDIETSPLGSKFQKPVRDNRKSHKIFELDMKPQAQSLIKGVTDDDDLFETNPRGRHEIRSRSPHRVPIFNDKQNKSLSQNRSIYRVPIFERDSSPGRSRFRRGLFETGKTLKTTETLHQRFLSPRISSSEHKHYQNVPSHKCLLKDNYKTHYVAPSLIEERPSRWPDTQKTVIMDPIKRQPVSKVEKSPILFQRLMDTKLQPPVPSINRQYGASREAANNVVNVQHNFQIQNQYPTRHTFDQVIPQPVPTEQIYSQIPRAQPQITYQPIYQINPQPNQTLQPIFDLPQQYKTHKQVPSRIQYQQKQNPSTSTKSNTVNRVTIKPVEKNEKKGGFDWTMVPIIIITVVSIAWLVLTLYDTQF